VVLRDEEEVAKGAKVTLVNKKTGEKKTTEVNEFGVFEIDDLRVNDLLGLDLKVSFPC